MLRTATLWPLTPDGGDCAFIESTRVFVVVDIAVTIALENWFADELVAVARVTGTKKRPLPPREGSLDRRETTQAT
jgi:hypothetical protein